MRQVAQQYIMSYQQNSYCQCIILVSNKYLNHTFKYRTEDFEQIQHFGATWCFTRFDNSQLFPIIVKCARYVEYSFYLTIGLTQYTRTRDAHSSTFSYSVWLLLTVLFFPWTFVIVHCDIDLVRFFVFTNQSNQSVSIFLSV